ncbi:MAG: alanine--tRNA ligase, partial [Chitinophagaceae bacterium]
NDHPQVIEIWNNVFIQFNRLKDGSLQLLPSKHVDTGMGFERLVRVIQGKSSNYDTDVFMPTITLLETITGKKYQFADTKQDIAFRVLADHIRAIACTIADGQLPSNNGAGYVIRRILRRAVRYYYSYLDFKAPLLYRLLPLIANQFSAVFPEINQQADFITKVIKEEEEAFLRTLEKGLKRIDDILQATQHNKELVINGKAVFELLDTYGFPLDLTKLIAAENGLSIDEAGFEQEMLQQKNRSRAASAIDTDDWIVLQPDGGKGFVGYNDILVETTVTRYRKVKLKGKESFQLVLQETPFYAESGGQVGDKGSLRFGDEVIEVTDTKKENNVTVHFTDKLPANINSNLIAAIDVEKRLYTTYNHTATHLLHAALRQVLGTHVAQKGSLVNEQNLRFDFSHFAKLSDDEIRQVELIVNEKIRENIPVVIKQMSKEAALEMGAMALFGEKYADEVRVVIIDPSYSIELCGGTHVMSTGMIGTFKIITETAVAAGVRRIEALTGSAAFNYLYDQFVSLKEIAGLLKTKDAVKAVEKILQDKAQLEKKVESLEAKQIAFMEKQLIEKSLVINGINFLGEVVEVGSSDQLKKLALQLKASLNNGLVVLTASIDGKAAVVIATDEQSGKDAGLLIKQVVAPLIKGGGGGNKILATAGGVDASNLSQIIANIKINL